MNLPEVAGLGLILAIKGSKFAIVMLIIVMIGNKYTVHRVDENPRISIFRTCSIVHRVSLTFKILSDN